MIYFRGGPIQGPGGPGPPNPIFFPKKIIKIKI
jgi:hypothetical protein